MDALLGDESRRECREPEIRDFFVPAADEKLSWKPQNLDSAGLRKFLYSSHGTSRALQDLTFLPPPDQKKSSKNLWRTW